ncbi:hypothetical protein Lal_00019621 [Lupinus albus]|nr:hypothetical protein Lal_00019621 [Lupinus albus]
MSFKDCHSEKIYISLYKLKLFYNVTLVFSGTLYPTANVLFPKICEIKLALVDWHKSTDIVIHQMAEVMYAKFEKYWGDIDALMSIGAVLDPRYKLYVGADGVNVEWRINEIKYPTLRRIARDLLTIPISTVASESSFSIGGRILTPRHSRLLPRGIDVSTRLAKR